MNENLLKIVKKFENRRVVVIGDLMLDVYIWGRADRISPEAPVPVVQVSRNSCCLGGAANVMRNVVTMGGAAYAAGVIGDDGDGERLRRELESYRIDPGDVVTVPGRRTTVKQRVIAGNQQLMRIDFEETRTIAPEYRTLLADAVMKLIAERRIDAVIFEDYGKGALAEDMVQAIADAARAAGIITMLDPKPGHLKPVRRLGVLKPNRLEAFGMADLADAPDGTPEERNSLLLEAARRIQERWEPDYLIISLAAEGLGLFAAGAEMVRIPTRAREVFDVSGAGDTLTAAFTLALSSGATPAEAAEIANHAAGIVVGKVGTVTVSAAELAASLDGTL